MIVYLYISLLTLYDHFVLQNSYTYVIRIDNVFSITEIDLDTPCVVKMENNQTFLQPPPAPDKDR